MLSGIIWVLLSPFMATIGICDGICVSWADKPLIIRTVGPWLAQHGWLSFAPGNVLYFTYGRYFFLVYLSIGLGLIGLHQSQTRYVPSVDRFTRFSYRFLLCFLLIAAVCDFVSYGIGVLSTVAWSVGFGLEMLAWVGITAGSILYGIAMLRLRVMPYWTGWLLMIGAILLPCMFFDRTLVMYWPNAQLLPYSFAWTILGGYQLMHPQEHKP
jgi:hypothetical protein